MKKTIGIALALAAVVGTYAYVNSQTATQSTTENKSAVDYSAIGNKLICPVMGGEINITQNTPKAEYNGKVYFFCCPGCVEKFNKEPEKYISGKGVKKDHKYGNGSSKKKGAKSHCPMEGQETKKDAQSGN